MGFSMFIIGFCGFYIGFFVLISITLFQLKSFSYTSSFSRGSKYRDNSSRRAGVANCTFTHYLYFMLHARLSAQCYMLHVMYGTLPASFLG